MLSRQGRKITSARQPSLTRWVIKIRAKLVGLLSHSLRRHPRLRRAAALLDVYFDVARHATAAVLPQVIQPDPREIYITLTANCNLRCIGCRYGRDFMPGKQLPFSLVRDLLDDCKALGIKNIRLYGGEPLLHKDLNRIVERSVGLGLNTWLTTNGILLKEKVDDLFAAGLRTIAVGFYGTGEEYNLYVQRPERYACMERGVAYTRERYGMSMNLRLGWVLMRPTCNLKAVRDMWQFAERYNAQVGVSLIHYSLPYFTEGPDRQLQFRPEDRGAIGKVVEELLRLKQLRPELLQQSEMALRSIPDWLLKGPEMKVPCERYRLLWVGADGTVQLCYVTFKLGDLHEKRLAEMLFTAEHKQASRDAFSLKCPNCHCSYHNRIERHAASRLRYSGLGWGQQLRELSGTGENPGPELEVPSGAPIRMDSQKNDSLVQIR
ncbi:MAG TPA: radical SAM protein [Candidatus Sulfotelmatobacter sp.]|nr:radical SAM protein [Candidatus Sulfotelmatobacter sp.]